MWSCEEVIYSTVQFILNKSVSVSQPFLFPPTLSVLFGSDLLLCLLLFMVVLFMMSIYEFLAVFCEPCWLLVYYFQ